MKISCEVISDLLPLYVEEVCSIETRQLVEAHLSECPDCQLELELLEKKLPNSNNLSNLQAAEGIQNLSRRWKQKMIQNLMNGALIMLVLVVIAILVLSFVGIRITVSN